MIYPEFGLYGLDFETSGADPDAHAPIQIGLARVHSDQVIDSFGSLVGGWKWNEWPWSEEAEGVHGINRADLQDEGVPNSWMVDAQATTWMIHNVPEALVRPTYALPVGWNVGSFDVPFVRKHFPYLSKLVGYRAIDLNSVCAHIAQNSREAFGKIKGEAQEYGLEMAAGWGGFRNAKLHDAEFDAVAGLYSYRYLLGERTDGN